MLHTHCSQLGLNASEPPTKRSRIANRRCNLPLDQDHDFNDWTKLLLLKWEVVIYSYVFTRYCSLWCPLICLQNLLLMEKFLTLEDCKVTWKEIFSSKDKFGEDGILKLSWNTEGGGVRNRICCSIKFKENENYHLRRNWRTCNNSVNWSEFHISEQLFLEADFKVNGPYSSVINLWEVIDFRITFYHFL